MSRISEVYRYKATGGCNEKAVVKGDCWRFTVLTPSLIRMEYDEMGRFEDRPTQTVINRYFDLPAFTVTEKNGAITIKTECVALTYTGGRFSANSLSAVFAGKMGASKRPWRFGEDAENLKGTARTLDNINGVCPLENGIMSRRGIVTLDDSRSLILAEDGWVESRGDAVDIYLFAYNTHHLDALQDYYRLTGNPPMIPRYALGNWWSRYYRYTQEEYEALMLRFKEKGLPFSVAVIDMDWHYTEIPSEYGSGWTGFSWNRELFPDHKAFLDFLHREGMEVTLNLHPAEGIAPHEDVYTAMARRMGIDPETGERVTFDAGDPKLIESYFQEILNPMEKEGVSFWWMDWQQGSVSSVPGLDPLWILNHYHYLDMKNSGRRPMIFSRYAGPGSHRYPVGFSGDTHATWESLDFQPYFTANATNIGYNWWSHDIGGHMYGDRSDERVTRWVQFGVFSPIMRLHSSLNIFQSKEPWLYGKEAEAVMVEFLQLRHRLIPYLYTMNYRGYKEGIPLMLPVYYLSPGEDLAYEYNRNEYFFGSELMAVPITAAADPVTGRGKAKVWLPEGLWFDFFTSHSYQGGRHVMYRDLCSIPVLVKAGGVIPMAPADMGNSTENPGTLHIAIFPGADNSFDLYEDDGRTNEYEKGAYAITRLDLKWGKTTVFTIARPKGDESVIPENRKYILEFRKIEDCEAITVTEDGTEKAFAKQYRDGSLLVEVEDVNGNLTVCFGEGVSISKNDYKAEIFDLLLKARWDNSPKMRIYRLLQEKGLDRFAAEITAMDIDPELRNALLEIAFSSQ